MAGSMFEIDIKGLRQVLAERGKGFAVLEIIQNGLDQNITRLDIEFTKDGRRAFLKVTDDDPEGFADIRHAYTFFAPSVKKGNAKQRGRFNIGEKLVLALCDYAKITTTTTAFEFQDGKRRQLRTKTERGSIFEGEMVMTQAEFDECMDSIHRVLWPTGIEVYLNGEKMATRTPFIIIEDVPLRTVLADAEGYLRQTTRNTEVHIHKALPGDDGGWLYELGIPVVQIGDDFHVDVQQKVPLNSDRNNVTPAYQRAIHTLLLNETSEHLDKETATHNWVSEALESPDVNPEAVRDVIKARYGDKAAIYDLSDREANHRVTAAGFNLVFGGSLTGNAWDNVRRAGAMMPAGQIMPTHPEKGVEYKTLEPRQDEIATINAIARLCEALMGFKINIRLVSEAAWGAQAGYASRQITFNKVHLPGGRKFLTGGITEAVVDLVVHELGHEFESNHLDDGYNHALTRLAAKLVFLVKRDPTLLDVQAVSVAA